MQYGFHDSKTLISDQNLKVGDKRVETDQDYKQDNL
jgi:hypothetical protein